MTRTKQPARAAVAFTVLLAVAAVSAPAGAAGKARKRRAPTAKEWYEKGSTHHKLGEYEEAIAAYKEAYRLGHHPVQLYNLALAYKDSGNPDDSIRYYELFLAEVPDSPLRADIEARIAELETLVGAAEKAAAPAPEATKPTESDSKVPAPEAGPSDTPAGVTPPSGAETPPKRKRSKVLAFGLLVGGTVVAASAAIVTGVLVSKYTGTDALVDRFPGQIVDLTGAY